MDFKPHFLGAIAFAILLLGTLTSNAGERRALGNTFKDITKPPLPDWLAVESDDYRTYIKNLQAIDCPVQTIRDIVTADVVAVFAAKRDEAIQARFQNYSYWKADTNETTA